MINMIIRNHASKLIFFDWEAGRPMTVTPALAGQAEAASMLELTIY